MHDVVKVRQLFVQSSKNKLTGAINCFVTLYAKCVTGNDPSAALQQLKVHQREHIAWERNTVWRQMLGQERHGAVGASDMMGGAILIREEESGIVNIPTPFGGFKLTRKNVFLVVAVTVFIVLMNRTSSKMDPKQTSALQF